MAMVGAGFSQSTNCHDVNSGVVIVEENDANDNAGFNVGTAVATVSASDFGADVAGCASFSIKVENAHGGLVRFYDGAAFVNGVATGMSATDPITIDACNYFGQSLKVTFTCEASGATCWGAWTFKLESGPVIMGRSYTLWCTDAGVNDVAAYEKVYGVPTAAIPCRNAVDAKFVADWVIPVECDPGVQDTAKVVLREYQAFDKDGRRGSAFDTITVLKIPMITAANAECPETDTMYCGVTDYPRPGGGYYTGPRMYKFNPDSMRCDTLWFCYVLDENKDGWFQDDEWKTTGDLEGTKCGIVFKKKVHKFEDPCSPIYKVTLEIKQTCAGGPGAQGCPAPAGGNELEEIAPGYYECTWWVYDFDTLPPVAECYTDEYEELEWLDADCDGDYEYVVIAPTGTHDCAAHTYLPPVIVNDNWSGIKTVKALFEGTTYLFQPDNTPNPDLPYGASLDTFRYHSPVKVPKSDWPSMIIYEAFDNCHLIGRDTCWILAKDRTKPVVVVDKGVTVSLSDKKVWVNAETFDEGSWDNCVDPQIFVRRADWYDACIDLCYNSKDEACGEHDPDKESALTPCYVGPHYDTLWVANLETDKNCDPVEAHYAKLLDWWCNDGVPCGELLYDAWLYDLIKYGTKECREHPYEIDDHYIHELILQAGDPYHGGETFSESFLDKFKVQKTHFHQCFDDPIVFPEIDVESAGSVDGSHAKPFDYKAYLDQLKQIGGGWSDAVPFSCEDACSKVTVEVLAIDYWCNWSKAWMDVWVEDKTPVSVVKDVTDTEISCRTYKDNRYEFPGEQHPVSIEYIVEQAKTGSSDAYASLDGIFGGYCKAWVDAHGNYVDAEWNEIDCDITLSDSICEIRDTFVKTRVYDEHYGYIWKTDSIYDLYYDERQIPLTKGIVAVNCDKNVQCAQEVWCEFDHCGEGYLFRKFKIWQGCPEDSDAYSPHAPDTIYRHQRVRVGNQCKLNKYMFDVPKDTTVYACGVEYDADGSGQVVGDAGVESTGDATYLADDDCRIVGIAHEDKVFKVVGGDEGCVKIIRTFYFADWCGGKPAAYDWYKDHDLVMFSCEQKILVIDTIPPVCVVLPSSTPVSGDGTADAPAVLEANGGCFFTFEGIVEVEDPCGLIDLYYELKDLKKEEVVETGTYLLEGTAAGYDFSIPDVAQGTYKFQVRVVDECQNEAYCEYYFDVLAGKKPGPVCITSLTADLQPWDIDQDGTIDTAATKVWANEFESSSIPACGEDYADLSFYIEWTDEASDSFDITRVSDSLAVGCDRLGTQMARMWVLSSGGSADYCDVLLVVTDNNAACGENTNAGSDLTGRIATELEQSVEQVQVRAELENGQVLNSVTTASGAYAFATGLGVKLTVTPEKNIGHDNGVSTLDLVKIQKHILGKALLDTDLRKVAADANGDGNIGTLDLIEIRKLILGKQDEFSNVNSWRFFEDQTSVESFVIDPIANPTRIDWTGVKIGDVNMDNDPSRSAGRSGKSLVFKVEDAEMIAGNQYKVDFRASNFTDINGYQFTLNFNQQVAKVVSVEGGALNLDEGNFGLNRLEEGFLTTSWNASEGITMPEDEVLFSVVFEAAQGASLSEVMTANSRVTDAEAYNSADQVHGISLTFETDAIVDGGFALHQNNPNPFTDKTQISFNLPEAMSASITVYDVTGKVIKMVDGDYAKGINMVSLTRKDLSTLGVLYYQLDTETFTATKKMVVIE